MTVVAIMPERLFEKMGRAKDAIEEYKKAAVLRAGWIKPHCIYYVYAESRQGGRRARVMRSCKEHDLILRFKDTSVFRCKDSPGFGTGCGAPPRYGPKKINRRRDDLYSRPSSCLEPRIRRELSDPPFIINLPLHIIKKQHHYSVRPLSFLDLSVPSASRNGRPPPLRLARSSVHRFRRLSSSEGLSTDRTASISNRLRLIDIT